MSDRDGGYDGSVDPTEVRVTDKIRKNIWLSEDLVNALEGIAAEDEVQLVTVMRQGLKHYVRHRNKEPKK